MKDKWLVLIKAKKSIFKAISEGVCKCDTKFSIDSRG